MHFNEQKIVFGEIFRFSFSKPREAFYGLYKFTYANLCLFCLAVDIHDLSANRGAKRLAKYQYQTPNTFHDLDPWTAE